MPYYSDDLVEEVRSRNDIVDVIGSYVHLEKKGSRFFGLCPFHGEKTPSFSVSPQTQMYHCFACGESGNVFTFLMKYDHLSFPEAVQTLADRCGVVLPQQEESIGSRQQKSLRERLFAVNRDAASYYYALLRGPRGERAKAYFTDRKLTDETLQKFGLGFADQYCDDLYRHLKGLGYDDDLLRESGLVSIDEKHGGRDKFWNRVMFPIMDARSRVIGFGGRVTGEGEPKYINSPETKIFHKSETLYGISLAKATRRPMLILCEGYMDVISLHQAGFDNAVASLGTALTEKAAQVLTRYTKQVFLSYDADGAGRKAALRAVPILRDAGLSVKVISLKPYKDPDELIKAKGAQEYEKRIGEAENAFLFEVRSAAEGYRLSDPEEKTAFFRQVAGMLLQFPEDLQRNSYIEVLCRQYRIKEDDLRRMVGESAALREGRRALPPPVSRQTKKKREDAVSQAERMLLTWLSQDNGLYGRICGRIGPKDFSQGLPQQVAEEVFASLERSGTVTAAEIVSKFTDEEQQKEAAALFTADDAHLDGEMEKKRAVRDVVFKIKNAALDRQKQEMDASDPDALLCWMEEKKELKKLQNLAL